MEGSTGAVRIVSRRLVRPDPATTRRSPDETTTTMHLTPWDLRMITVDYIQKGLLLPKPPAPADHGFVDGLASSLALALARFYPLAGRLAVEDATTTGGGGPEGVVVSLRCTGDGAEFVHAEAPEVTVGDIVTPGGPAAAGHCYYIPSSLVWSLFLVGCRARVDGIPQEYMGNAVTTAVARSAAGDVVGRGLGWAAWLLNRAVAAFDEARVRDELASWPRDPRFLYAQAGAGAAARILTGSSPRFDVYGNDFGWGRPVAVRSGAGNKVDGKVTVYEGRGGGGSMALEVCLAPKALARLVADEEFMGAVQ